MKRMKKALGLAAVLSLLVTLPVAPASAWDVTENIRNIGDGLAAAVGGEVINCGRSWADEMQKRSVLGVVSGAVGCGLNTAITAVNSGLTLGTLGFVPVKSNGWTSGPPLPLP